MLAIEIFGKIVQGLGYTVLVTGVSLILGALGGLPLVALRRTRFAPLRWLARIVTDVVRVVPPITWLFMIFFGLPQFGIDLDPIPAAITGMSIIASGYFAEIYRSGLLAIDKGQWEAGTALGMSRWHQLRWIVAPQAFRVLLPAGAAYAIALLKDSALTSAIGVQDLTYQANLASRQTHEGLLAFFIAGLIYIGLSTPLALASRRVDSSLRNRMGLAA